MAARGVKGPLATYNAEVIATPCRTCGKGFPERCKGNLRPNATPAHATRLADAGYRWNRSTGELEKLHVESSQVAEADRTAPSAGGQSERSEAGDDIGRNQAGAA